MDERTSTRVAIGTTIECGVAGKRFIARLWNLSADGCMIQFVGRGMEEGDEVEVEFDLGITVPGLVAWQQKSYGGIWFSLQLHEATVGHLDVAKSCGRTYFQLPNLLHPLQGVVVE